MRTLQCFVIMPSGKNPPMALVADDKDGLCRRPSGCNDHAAAVTVDFQAVYEYIVQEAIADVNGRVAAQGLRIDATRGEDLAQGGNVVSQFIDRICRADITITDVTGLNPNVLLEYGIRLSVRDSLNILLCHRGMRLPLDIADQRWIEYTQDMPGAKAAKKEIGRAIENNLPALMRQPPDTVENLFRRTVEAATGRHLERRLAQAYEPVPALMKELVNELHRVRPSPALRDRCWSFLESLANTQADDPFGYEPAIQTYRLLTSLEGFRDKRRDAFYRLHEICAVDPSREAEAQGYLEQAKALED